MERRVLIYYLLDMCNEEPNLNPRSVYCVKETCAILEISGKTLAKLRKQGAIVPINPDERNFRYTGEAIRNLWCVVNRLPI